MLTFKRTQSQLSLMLHAREDGDGERMVIFKGCHSMQMQSWLYFEVGKAKGDMAMDGGKRGESNKLVIELFEIQATGSKISMVEALCFRSYGSLIIRLLKTFSSSIDHLCLG